MDSNDTLRSALATDVIFHKINAEKGEGEPLAETYTVDGYPTYILMNDQGVVVDRWSGYDDPESFLATMRKAVGDPTTVEQKAARFTAGPTLAFAEKLADLARESGRPEDAIRYYGDAQRLNPGEPSKYLPAILDARYASWKTGGSIDDLENAAHALMGAPKRTLDDTVHVVSVMGRVAKKKADPGLLAPFLKEAIAAAEASSGKPAEEALQRLQLRKALDVDHDLPKAVALKRNAMHAGWQNDPEALNEFAWWCFENETNLEEAQALAQKGVELAAPGEKKAMILDTLAEICNARGNCGDAADIEFRAAKEDPANDHYKERAVEFEKLLADQRGTTTRI